jgi:hypothetical protein
MADPTKDTVSKPSPGFEPGFEDAMHSLRKLRRKALRHNDFNGAMRLSSGEVLILVDAALALLDREDVKVAKAQIVENFRYE